MQQRVTEYLNKFRNQVRPFFEEQQTETTTQRCSIYITPQKLSILHIDKTPDATNLLFSQIIKFDAFEDLSLVLTAIVEKHELQEIPTYLLLLPNEYQLFLIESLPVKGDELREAVNWRLQSLIGYPIKEATTDYFLLPPKKTTQSNPMVAGVAAKTNDITKLISLIKETGFKLTSITIPEIAMRNLTALYENDEKSTAFIYFYEKLAIINITQQGKIYFSRRIDITENYEEFSLEIMRYFDYFQSQWRIPTPSRIFITAENKNSADIAAELSKLILMKIEPFTHPSIPADATHCLLSYGAGLNEDAKHA